MLQLGALLTVALCGCGRLPLDLLIEVERDGVPYPMRLSLMDAALVQHTPWCDNTGAESPVDWIRYRGVSEDVEVRIEPQLACALRIGPETECVAGHYDASIKGDNGGDKPLATVSGDTACPTSASQTDTGKVTLTREGVKTFTRWAQEGTRIQVFINGERQTKFKQQDEAVTAGYTAKHDPLPVLAIVGVVAAAVATLALAGGG